MDVTLEYQVTLELVRFPGDVRTNFIDLMISSIELDIYFQHWHQVPSS